ncbi:MAG: hypothetical protein ABSE85_07630 [Candidatus Korobacteraceae bacterium]
MPTFTCGLLRVIPIKFLVLLAQRQVYRLQRRQIKFSYLRLIGYGQRVINLSRRLAASCQRRIRLLQQLLTQNPVEVTYGNALALQ